MFSQSDVQEFDTDSEPDPPLFKLGVQTTTYFKSWTDEVFAM